eukprot:TRINITY_DN277_c2_g1_i1.p1 TRINITY_DN277_c2_g1~~TRINITY_DN277_c2_g1_i1.p1  ORF type:complete len:401 (-),score=124.65 TRINITY_DN277_c2_g1_i1:217-1419(-)
MGDSFTEKQTEILATFQEITGEDDITKCIHFLQASNWDISRAVDLSMDQGASSSSSSSRRVPAPSPSPAPLPATNRRNGGPSPPSQPPPPGGGGRRAPVARRQARDSVFPWPINIVYRLLTAPITFGYSIFAGFFRFGYSFLSSIVPHQPRENIAPTQEAQKTIEDLSDRFGSNHPSFLTGTYVNACDVARAQCKLLLVYIHHSTNETANTFCRDTLCTEDMREFLDQHFVAWASDVKYPQGYRVRQVLGGSTYPFIAVLYCNPKDSSNVGIVDKIEGLMPSDDLKARLLQSSGNFETTLSSARLSRERQATDRIIRQEQDQAYLESLAEDEAKERRAREEADRVIAEEKKRVEEEQTKFRAREYRRNNIPPEPVVGEKEATAIVIKLPEGRQLRRRPLR